ncbi:MAG: major capsid protein [Prevotella sp.]|nr:major capsid protein [Candidatus Prevotella equi]
MEASLYSQYVKTYFPALVTSVVERLNGERRTALPYLYRDLLQTTYSADGRWASILAEYTRVAADVISLDSELPIKSRDMIETAQGEIPKIGLKLYMTEKQMKDLDAMIALNQPIDRIINVMFADLPRVIEAVYERIEDIFLSELSSGVGVSERNNGTGVRVDMDFVEGNQFGSTVAWSDLEHSTPLDDMQKVFDKAMEDNNNITDIYADDTWLRGFYMSQQVRGQYAFNMGVATAGGANYPILDFDKAAQVVLTKWGATLHRVARKIKTEINGKKQSHSPWAKGVASFICDPIVGDLVWTTCAEDTRRVPGVEYVNADEFILASRYSTNDPLREFTASQAMAIPVLNNVDRIYTQNSTEVQE